MSEQVNWPSTWLHDTSVSPPQPAINTMSSGRTQTASTAACRTTLMPPPFFALLSTGREDPAWFEHSLLAEEMGVALVALSGPVGA